MALTADTEYPVEAGFAGSFNDIPAASSATMYKGSMVGLNSSGYARALTAGDLFLGHASAQCDNSSGSDADLNVNVRQGRYRMQVTITSVAVTDVGKEVYASDDGTYTITRSVSALVSKVGKVVRYVTTNTAIVEFEPHDIDKPFVAELDVETGEDTADHVLLPAWMNRRGVVIELVYAIITEAMVGSSEDQGIITVYDSDDNALATLTPSDAAADAIGDMVIGTNPILISGATGDAAKYLAAGKGIDCKVTQATSGGTPAGKMKVYLVVRDLI